ncbi:thioredoxin domain-containing protein [Mucilaginibacter rigui]|uniref:Thioredoxin domain-containing protein n=1 Tax=Mucilaginibacter rigui TaxID=534635 RepID=A0ABR7X420_9SPHI|nr:thioredoxin domain-containing protein [Mucilaginibacter rigui]MBD1385328.1 thioredoxin domain-containing protein [Mucilaginibacter rigui]
MKINKISESGVNQVLGIVQIVFMILLLAYVYNLNTQLTRINKKLSAISNTGTKTPGTIKINPDSRSPTMGTGTATVTMTIFSDFECSFCKVFATDIFPRLKKQYVDKGLMQVNFRHLPLAIHKNALMAAEASACINEQGKFWDLHDYLFKNQEKLNNNLINNWASDNNIDTAKLAGCIINHTYKTKVDKDIDEANSAGIQGTPAIIINGRMVMGAKPFEYFAEVIDKEIAKTPGRTAAETCN